MLACVAVGGLWLLFAINGFLSRFPYARREVVPHPLTVGVPGRVTVTISSTSGQRGQAVSKALAESLDIREQAAAELTGGMSTKATVSRTAHSFALSYSLLPSRRGRWPLGPALVHSADPLGIVSGRHLCRRGRAHPRMAVDCRAHGHGRRAHGPR